MKSKATTFSVTAALVLFMAQASAQASAQTEVELIVNGGFETGDFTGWSQPAIDPSPWSVVSFNPLGGSFAAYNPAESTAAAETTLYQSINPSPVNNITSAGYWYYDQGGSGTVGMATQLTFADGTSVQDTLYANDPAYQENAWTFLNLEPFLLDYAGKSLVEIGFYPKAGGSEEIDNVAIMASPEPATWVLLAAGVAVRVVYLRCPRKVAAG